jgi:hypothetical protein
MQFAFRIIMSQAILRLRRAQARMAGPPRHRRLALRRCAAERRAHFAARPTWRRTLHSAPAQPSTRKPEPPITEHPPAPPV